MGNYSLDLQYARWEDEKDVLRSFREKFHVPKVNGNDVCYFTGNSLGLQPKSTEKYVLQELEDWKNLAVQGHVKPLNPWVSYGEMVSEKMAALVGALPSEVVLMNSLTANLHLMLVSFYRPTKARHKILINPFMFSSDYFALCSHVRFHGLDPKETIIVLPASEEGLVHTDVLERILQEHGKTIALILMEGVNYFTGQAIDITRITKEAHKEGCFVGIDLAHAVGNLPLTLHHSNVDFAVWCSYKYLNGGPGTVGGCFVHQRHHDCDDMPRFSGWWGNELAIRFKLNHNFHPACGVAAWQLSNPPILSLACLKASLELFEQASIDKLREKSIQLTGYLEFVLENLKSDAFAIITPKNSHQRGCQLSLRLKNNAEGVVHRLRSAGIIVDYRYPDVIRIAPTPLYNTFTEIYKLFEYLKTAGFNT